MISLTRTPCDMQPAYRHTGLSILLLSCLLSACTQAQDGNGGSKKKQEKVPVVLVDVSHQTVPLRVEGIGNVESITTVSVKSRVDGQILRAHIADGAQVKQVQVLFEIDARPFVAQLKQAQANLVRDQALLARAQSQDERYRDLLQKNFVSPEAYSQIKANLDSARATVAADRAAVESARLQVEYSTIHSPISGRAGKIMIAQGNLVKANDTSGLVVLNQISPIYVNFAVPEPALNDVRRAMALGPLAVTISYTTADGKSQEVPGRLAFIDNNIDATTGTVKLRAILENRDALLWPGQFVHATVVLGQQNNAIVIPSQAVQSGPKGPYVFVVDPQKLTAQVRNVSIDRVDGVITVIGKGLKTGERIVVDGQSRLLPGSAVIIKNEAKSS